MLHAAGTVHRDVSPDNVILRPGTGAVLLDLGAARREIGDRVRATTVMLKSGYAPIEQYAHDPDCPVGPWSDVYALAAVLHHAALGESPPPSPLRVMRDTRVPLAARAPEGMSADFAEAIDVAMAVRPEERPQSATAFRARLGLDEEPPGLARIEPAPAEPVTAGAVRRRPSVGSLILAASMLVVFAVSVTAWIRAVPVPVNPEPLAEASPSTPVASVPAQPTRSMSGNGSVPSDAALGRSTARPAAPLPATVKLIVVPWAEVWVNGVKRGVSPPLTSVTLTPGVHRIELRNPAAGAHVRRVDVKAGQSVSITHRFDSTPTK
jgi:serine/threonine protein kinase